MKRLTTALTLGCTCLSVLAQGRFTFNQSGTYQQLPYAAGAGLSDGSISGADDFQFSQDTGITKVAWWSQYPARPVERFLISFLADDHGMPGQVLYTLDAKAPTAEAWSTLTLYSTALPTPFAAEANVPYWFSVVNPTYPGWVWTISTSTDNRPWSAYKFDQGWTRSNLLQYSFALNVTPAFVPEPRAFCLLTLGVTCLL